MGIFKADHYRFFAIGFGVGALIVAVNAPGFEGADFTPSAHAVEHSELHPEFR